MTADTETARADQEPLLATRGVSKAFGGFWAVRQVSLSVYPGEIVGLIGPNGAGKTTLFNVISRFLPLTEGEIRFSGRRLDRLQPHIPTQLGLVRTFQIPRIFSRMSVLENVKFAAQDQPGENLIKTLLAPQAVRRREAAIEEQARELVEYFGLGHLMDEYAGALSGGQRKLLVLARAMMGEPKMMLLDEPMAGVNPALKEELLSYILSLRDQRVTFLVVEHDMDMIMRISDRILCLADGRLIATGEPDTVASDPQVVTAYLGEAT